MTKNEALKAAIDGKKVRCLEWPNQKSHIYWNGTSFIFRSSIIKGINFACEGEIVATVDINENSYKTWQILPECVDFAEAWKAYEDGKVIQSTSSGEKYQNKQYGAFIRVDAIRGKWLILEDK